MNFSETFDQHKLNYILTHKSQFKCKVYDDSYDPFNTASKLLAKSTKGCVRVDYHQSGGRNFGRFFANGGTSLQTICKEIRHTISSEFYTDLDMVNAHPVILKSMCEKNSIECSKLNEYINKREDKLNELIEQCDISRDDAKDVFLSLINGGCAKYEDLKDPPKFLRRFKNEVSNIIEEICDIYPTEYEISKQSHPNNPKGSTVNKIMCNYENEIIQCVLEFYRSKKIIDNNCVLCFDGIMIPKHEKIEEYIDDCEIYIFKHTQIPAKLKIKEMSMGFKLPIDIGEYDEYIPFDGSDEFCWLEFDQKWRGHQFKSLEDVIFSVRSDINRVFCKIEQGNGFMVKKTDCGDNIIDIIDMKSNFTDLYFNVLEKGKVKELSFKKFIQLFGNDLNRFRAIDFAPNSTDPKLFNLWTGYKAKIVSIEGGILKILPILTHIREVYCNNCEVSYEYFLDLLYYMIKYPERPLGIATFIYSHRQGSGKNIILDFLQKYVFGDNVSYYTTGLDTILEKHNSALKNKKFVVVDELASSSDNWVGSFDRLKSMMTGNSLVINPKGINQYSIKNVLSWFLVSNHDDCIRIEQSDRRYFCLSVNEKYIGNIEYFKKLGKSFNQDCGNEFYTYIINRGDNRDVNISIPPMNEFKKSIISRGFSTSLRYLFSIDCSEFDENESLTVRACDLFERYTWWCSHNKEKTKSSTKFFLDIKKYITKERTAKGCMYDLTSINIDGYP